VLPSRAITRNGYAPAGEVPPAFCRFDGFAARLTETMLVTNLGLRTGKNLRWDAETMAATGCPEAAPFIKRDYRTGW